MRRLTNRSNLPELFVRAAERDTYSKGRADYSATGLISSPRRNLLMRRHPTQDDAADRVWSVWGQACHAVLERAAGSVDPRELVLQVREIVQGADTPDAKVELLSTLLQGAEDASDLIERRLYAQYGVWVVSGQIDLLRATEGKFAICDWKVTTTDTWVWGGRDEWEQQLNIYAALARRNGYEPDSLSIYPIFRNWDPKNVTVKELRWVNEYPATPVMQIPIPMWEPERAEAFVQERVDAHAAARHLEDDQLPECTAGERWERGGKSGRCQRWCKAFKFCSQARAEFAQRPGKIVAAA